MAIHKFSTLRKTLLTLLAMLLLSLPSTGCASKPKAIPQNLGAEAGIRILSRNPHDPLAYTQGLLYEDGYFYESTGLYGQSSLRKVDPESGEVLQQVALDDAFFAEGLALLDGRLYQLTWKEHTGFIYDQEGFKEVGSISYPFEGWGLSTDGVSLILSDGSNSLYFLNPKSFEVQRSIQVLDGTKSITWLNELEYIQGEIYANVYYSDKIVRIDPLDGRVLGWIDCSALRAGDESRRIDDVLNGIAYDASSDRLFVTGKLWPSVYEIALVPLPAP